MPSVMIIDDYAKCILLWNQEEEKKDRKCTTVDFHKPVIATEKKSVMFIVLRYLHWGPKDFAFAFLLVRPSG